MGHEHGYWWHEETDCHYRRPQAVQYVPVKQEVKVTVNMRDKNDAKHTRQEVIYTDKFDFTPDSGWEIVNFTIG